MARKRKKRDPDLYNVEAGRRLEALFDRVRVELGFDTKDELWRYLGVHRSAPQVWMRGENPPSRAVGSRIAEKMGMSYTDILAEWEGTDPEVDAASVIKALEWALTKVRSGEWSTQEQAGGLPAAGRVAGEQAVLRSKQRRNPGRSPSETPTRRRPASSP